MVKKIITLLGSTGYLGTEIVKVASGDKREFKLRVVMRGEEESKEVFKRVLSPREEEKDDEGSLLETKKDIGKVSKGVMSIGFFAGEVP